MTNLEQRLLGGAQDFTEDELSKMIYTGCVVNEEVGDINRYSPLESSRDIQTILEVSNRYFSILWERGSLPYRGNSFKHQPREVYKHINTKTIEIITWEDYI